MTFRRLCSFLQICFELNLTIALFAMRVLGWKRMEEIKNGMGWDGTANMLVEIGLDCLSVHVGYHDASNISIRE